MDISKPKKSFIHKLDLINFRNYDSLSFEVDSDAVLVHGPNGIGKTNILEAMSLLVPGRGLRNAKFLEMQNSSQGHGWNIFASISGMFGKSGIEIKPVLDSKAKTNRKEMVVDGVAVKSQNKIFENISILWLTPQMDQIFLDSGSSRRRFFDRIVNNFSKNHSSVLAKYDYLLRERMHIIKQDNYDVNWVSIIERKIAETSVIISEARKNMCDYLNDIISKMEYKFPKAHVSFEGEVEQKLDTVTALQLENEICDLLQHNRGIDRHNGRTNAGIHRSDLIVCYRAKNENAKHCSTGEQKSLLISIFLGEVLAHVKWYNRVPILLLDDIMSHLDTEKRVVIFDIISQLKAQVFITAVDADSVNYGDMSLQSVSIKNGNLIS